jgi:hypothetical protein
MLHRFYQMNTSSKKIPIFQCTFRILEFLFEENKKKYVPKTVSSIYEESRGLIEHRVFKKHGRRGAIIFDPCGPISLRRKIYVK